MARLLVVDDDPVILDHARLCLAGAGHEVLVAPDGEAADRIAAGERIDLVLTDVYMPGLDGFGLADRLRERDGPFAPPVIFLSGIEDRENYRRALGVRGADFLIKPVSCEEMRRTVLVHLGRAEPRPASDLPRVPGFRIDRPLGRGATSHVFLARRERTGETCALKAIAMPDDPEEQGPLIRRFAAECAILEQVEDRGIARVLEHGVVDDCLYIALEYLPGGELLAERGKPLPAGRALDEALQLARTLGTIHARGVVHRDLKPANLLRRADGTLALVDFGIARREHHRLTTMGDLMGTPTYMSPEQFSGERADARADVYALGCLFFEMLTGERAFRGETVPALFHAHAFGPRPRLPERLAAFQPVLDRMVATDRAARFVDGGDAAKALEALRERLRETPAA